MGKTIETLLSIAEEHGWTFGNTEDEYMFSKYSPAGQDFSFTISDEGMGAIGLIDSLTQYIDNFDVSYETYLWLDDSGHGRNGAPCDMRELYEDMHACEDMMKELLDAWTKRTHKHTIHATITITGSGIRTREDAINELSVMLGCYEDMSDTDTEITIKPYEHE